jgi:hypothetical protein
VQPFLKEYCINISWKAGKREQIEDIWLNYVMFIIVLFGIGLFNKQFPTKIASLN